MVYASAAIVMQSVRKVKLQRPVCGDDFCCGPLKRPSRHYEVIRSHGPKGLADDFETTHIRSQDLRHDNATIGLLVVLNHRNQGARQSQA